MTGEGNKKKRDPIFSVCFVVFVVACVGVVGAYVDEHFIQTDETVVSNGDSVTINYVGTYYAPYGDANAVVFDTTYSDIGNNDGVKKAYDFNSSSYKTITVDVGDGDYLAMFENSLVGHKVGDKYTVEIPVGEGYLAPSNSSQTSSMTLSIPKTQVMTLAQFNEIYEDITLTAGKVTSITSAYGWPATVVLEGSTNMVYITNSPETSQTYQYIGNEDSEFGEVSYSVTSVSDSTISATISFDGYTTVGNDGEIQMIKINVDGTPIYVTSIGSGSFDYKTCAERDNITLYFEIEIVSIE